MIMQNCSRIPTWGGSPKLGVPILGVPIMRVIVSLGVYIGIPLFWETTIFGESRVCSSYLFVHAIHKF